MIHKSSTKGLGMIERYRKKPVVVETMLWDGTKDRADEIRAWIGRGPLAEHQFFMPSEMTGVHSHSQLWVEHSHSWVSVPTGHRVVRELDGKGFYPLSPEGLATGYEAAKVPA